MKLAWEEHGSGAPLLLIHGLGYTREGWGPAAHRLAGRYRVLRFDNRGIGGSDAPPGPYSVEQLAGDTLQVLDEAGVERAHVVGGSLGGMVAQQVASASPERVEKLVLACTTPGGKDAYPMPEVTVKLFGEAPALEPLVALRRFVENALGPNPPDGLADEMFAYRVAHPPNPAGWQAQAAAGAAWDAGDRLARIEAPTLVLTGTADNVVDPRNAQLLAERIPGARLETIEGGGHTFFWERSEAFADAVERFLE